MKQQLDSIYIELIVLASQMDIENVWMQGDLEILINGEKPYSENDIIDLDCFLKSLESDGEYFIFSCNCGIPECGGWLKGIKVIHKEKTIQWINLNNQKTWLLDKAKIEKDLKIVRNEVNIYKQYFKQKEIEYVGVGYDW